MKYWHVITHSCSSFNCSLTKPTLPEGNEWIITYHMKPLILNVFPWQHTDGQYLRLAKNGHTGCIQIILVYCLKEVFHVSSLPVQTVSWKEAGITHETKARTIGVIFYNDVGEIFWPQPNRSLKLGHVTGQGSMSPTWVGRVSDLGKMAVIKSVKTWIILLYIWLHL